MDQEQAYDLISEIARLRDAQEKANDIADEVAGPRCGHGYRIFSCEFCKAREGWPLHEGNDQAQSVSNAKRNDGS